MSNNYLNMDLLRFTTAGSVDDGKSTLIGRLLCDSKSIFEDQMEAIENASSKKGEEKVNLALLTVNEKFWVTSDLGKSLKICVIKPM